MCSGRRNEFSSETIYTGVPVEFGATGVENTGKGNGEGPLCLIEELNGFEAEGLAG